MIRLVQALVAGPEVVMAAVADDASLAAAEPASSDRSTAAPPEPVPASAEPTPAPEGLWVETALCSSCGDCLEINRELFVYDAKAQVTTSAGTFKERVTAAERCPSRRIHPGRPPNPKEKNLDALIARARAFDGRERGRSSRRRLREGSSGELSPCGTKVLRAVRRPGREHPRPLG